MPARVHETQHRVQGGSDARGRRFEHQPLAGPRFEAVTVQVFLVEDAVDGGGKRQCLRPARRAVRLELGDLGQPSYDESGGVGRPQRREQAEAVPAQRSLRPQRDLQLQPTLPGPVLDGGTGGLRIALRHVRAQVFVRDDPSRQGRVVEQDRARVGQVRPLQAQHDRRPLLRTRWCHAADRGRADLGHGYGRREQRQSRQRAGST